MGHYHLRLYIAGDGPNSRLAKVNLHEMCETHLAGRYRLEVIDVLGDPKAALSDSIVVTPTLIKVGPPPVKRIVGNLGNIGSILQTLGLESA
jgi:circadian clock protein KaiB